jgi:hypothetical protein
MAAASLSAGISHRESGIKVLSYGFKVIRRDVVMLFGPAVATTPYV